MKMSRRGLLQNLATLTTWPRILRASSRDQIFAPGITVGFSREGQINNLSLGAQRVPIRFTAATVLTDCVAQGSTFSSLPGGAIEFRSRHVHQTSHRECMVIDRYSPTLSSIRWELEILGSGSPWSTPIVTRLIWNQTETAKFWTAWDRPPGVGTGWRDPLVPSSFADLSLSYGGHIKEAEAFSLPLATILDASADVGLSLVQSPESVLLDMRLTTSKHGEVIFTRIHHRIVDSSLIRFAMDLVPHPADWRAALGWMVKRYSGYFDPPNPEVYRLDGCGAYSAYQGRLDRDKLRKMTFSVNWNARFDFPFQGMMIPPVSRDEVWRSWYRKPTSLARMSRYDSQMKQAGFHVLEYFVLTECGNHVAKTPLPKKARSDQESWRDANDFVHYGIAGAVVRRPDGTIQYSDWFDSVVVDPAEPVWCDFLIGQIKRLINELPDSDGICIDRLDWLTLYNGFLDDGVSWLDGRPARSLLMSWKETGAKIASLIHQAGKFVYANPLVRRLDAVPFIDGFYDEYADDPNMLNLSAMLALRKPAIGWTRDTATLGADPDALFQRHLHMGVFPMVPFPGADHSIAPDPWAERHYLDYGPLLAGIRGKQWVLEPHAISIDRSACVNLFKVPDGHAVPITFAKHTPEVSVTLRNFAVAQPSAVSIQAILPAASKPLALVGEWTGGDLKIEVPLNRGCALVRIRAISGSKPNGR
jgi:hypothetical protein